MIQERTVTQEPISTPERIIEATFCVVARRTISGTRIPLIAREMGMSQGIIHYHFETKEQLLVRLHEWLLKAFTEMRGVTTGWSGAHLLEEDPVRAMIEYQRVLIGPERDMIRVFYDFWVQAVRGQSPLAAGMRAHFDAYRDLLKRAMFDGRDDARASASSVAPALFLSLLEGAALQLILGPDAFDADAYFAAVKRLADELSGA